MGVVYDKGMFDLEYFWLREAIAEIEEHAPQGDRLRINSILMRYASRAVSEIRDIGEYESHPQRERNLVQHLKRNRIVGELIEGFSTDILGLPYDQLVKVRESGAKALKSIAHAAFEIYHPNKAEPLCAGTVEEYAHDMKKMESIDSLFD